MIHPFYPVKITTLWLDEARNVTLLWRDHALQLLNCNYVGKSFPFFTFKNQEFSLVQCPSDSYCEWEQAENGSLLMERGETFVKTCFRLWLWLYFQNMTTIFWTFVLWPFDSLHVQYEYECVTWTTGEDGESWERVTQRKWQETPVVCLTKE